MYTYICMWYVSIMLYMNWNVMWYYSIQISWIKLFWRIRFVNFLVYTCRCFKTHPPRSSTPPHPSPPLHPHACLSCNLCVLTLWRPFVLALHRHKGHPALIIISTTFAFFRFVAAPIFHVSSSRTKPSPSPGSLHPRPSRPTPFVGFLEPFASRRDNKTRK